MTKLFYLLFGGYLENALNLSYWMARIGHDQFLENLVVEDSTDVKLESSLVKSSGSSLDGL